MDDATLTTPASDEAVTPAEGVTGAESSLSHLGYTWVWPPLIQCKGLFLLAAARDMPEPTFCISTFMYMVHFLYPSQVLFVCPWQLLLCDVNILAILEGLSHLQLWHVRYRLRRGTSVPTAGH